MLIYKVTFVKNKIDSCRAIVRSPVFEGDVMYEAHNNLLIYALIKAENETQAMDRANRLVSDYKQIAR